MPWHAPPAPLFGRAVLVQLLAVAVAAIGAAGLATLVPATTLFPVKAALVAAGIGVVVLRYVAPHHPFEHFGPANIITTGRAAMVAIVAALIGEPRGDGTAWAAALLCLAIVALDGVDGWAARRWQVASDFGARFDMETDALLILVLAVLVWQHEKAGAWIVLAGAMRYVFVAAGYVWRWMNRPLPPSVRRKAVCVVQIAGLALAVSPFVTSPLSLLIAAATLAALTWSFGVDVLWLRRQDA